ncbi:MAG: hypothetical protein HKO59_02600 [Phycisphaerales bacterium]|nr:hypothetical protein [Phycisphaerae bacterium]NNF44777.1 hypothetical protein [Phycisphaerales bacterium]NNM24871.1 hypothetical protein [Phycisphaerales bacterium]
MVSIFRTLTVATVLSSLLLLLFWQLTAHQDRRTIAELRSLNEAMTARLEAQRLMFERLARSHRLGHLKVIDQSHRVDGSVNETTLLFIELDDEGSELARQTIHLPGGVVYIDTWTVKFAHDSVAEGHPLWGRTLVLLRRIYSELLSPADGIPIDTPGAVPAGYASSDVGRFEQQLWANFWQIATDRDLAAEMGVRVAQGEAVYMAVARGQSFDLAVDASGGVTLTPVASSDAPAAAPAQG